MNKKLVAVIVLGHVVFVGALVAGVLLKCEPAVVATCFVYKAVWVFFE